MSGGTTMYPNIAERL